MDHRIEITLDQVFTYTRCHTSTPRFLCALYSMPYVGQGSDDKRSMQGPESMPRSILCFPNSRTVRTWPGRPGGTYTDSLSCVQIRADRKHHCKFFLATRALHISDLGSGRVAKISLSCSGCGTYASHTRHDGKQGSRRFRKRDPQHLLYQMLSVRRGRTCCIEARQVTPRTFSAQMIAAGTLLGRLEERRERETMGCVG